MRDIAWKLSDTEGNETYAGMSDFIDSFTGEKKTKFHFVEGGRIGIAWEGKHHSGASIPKFDPNDRKCLLLPSPQLATTCSQPLDTPSIQGFDIEFKQLPIDHSTDGKTSGWPFNLPKRCSVKPSGNLQDKIDGRCFTIFWGPRDGVEGVTTGEVDEELEDRPRIMLEWSAYNVTKADGKVVPCKESIWYKDKEPVAYQRTIEGKDTGMF